MKRLILLLVMLVAVAGTAFSQTNYYEDGLNYFKQGNYDKAVEALTKAANTADANQQKAQIKLNQALKCQDAMARAKKAYGAGRYTEARNAYNEVLALNANDANAKQGVANCDAKLSNSGSGQTTFTPSLTVTPAEQVIPAMGGTVSFSVKSNESWLVSEIASGKWFSVSQSGNTVSVTASVNDTTGQRKGDLTVKSASGLTKKVSFVQEKGEYYLDLSSYAVYPSHTTDSRAT